MFIFILSKPPLLSTKGEAWMSLKAGTVYPVQISAFESVNRFFVQVVDDDDEWSDLMSQLDNCECLEVIENPEVGMLCLVDSETDLQRAKIIRKSDFTTMCFCVDTGELVYFQNEMERIYRIPESILNHMPFQAVSCRLAGIKAQSDYSWTNNIYQKVVRRIQQQRVHVLKQIAPEEDDFKLTGMRHRYDVILLDQGPNNEDINVNDLLVKYQLAEPYEQEQQKPQKSESKSL